MTPLCTLYCSLVYPYLHYCASVWSLTYQSNLKRLITLQKRVDKIISGKSPFDARANPIFVSLRILKFEYIIQLQIDKLCIFTKKAFLLIVSMTCFYLTVMYALMTLDLRSKNSFRLSYCGTIVKKFSLHFHGPKIFDSLSL